MNQREISDRFNGKDLSVHVDLASESARVLDASGTPLPAVTGFWLAGYAFHPETEVFTANRR